MASSRRRPISPQTFRLGDSPTGKDECASWSLRRLRRSAPSPSILVPLEQRGHSFAVTRMLSVGSTCKTSSTCSRYLTVISIVLSASIELTLMTAASLMAWIPCSPPMPSSVLGMSPRLLTLKRDSIRGEMGFPSRLVRNSLRTEASGGLATQVDESHLSALTQAVHHALRDIDPAAAALEDHAV